VTDGDRRATLILPWEQLHFALKTADTTLSNEIFLTNLKKNLAGNFEFTLDTSTFHRLSIEFEFHSEKCNGSESAQDIMNKYFDSDGFIKRSLNSVTRACAINKLFSSQIVVFQDDFSGYYMLDKNAKTKTP
jgi:phage terminase large subunit-like protein